LLLTIEKLVYGGDGLARLPAPSPADDRRQGKAVFVPFVLGGEQVEASLADEKPGFVRARAVEIVQPAPHRTSPPCPYFASCGGCHYQHANYDHQLEIKREILRENLRRIAKLELQSEIQVHSSPPWHYRNRSRLQVRTRPEFAAGYFKLASHEVLPVEQCPISSPLINRGIAALWQAGRAGKVVEGVREVEFFATGDAAGNEKQLLIEIYCAPEARRAAVRSWGEELCASLPEIAGVVAFREPQKGVYEPLVAVGASEVIYHSKTDSWRVSAGSFFQTNRFLTDELIEIVTAGRSGELALDLYAGVGLFSTFLARRFSHVVSVESSAPAARDLGHNLPVNGRAVQIETEQYLTGKRAARVGVAGAGDSTQIPSDGKAPDLIVVDPPRSGLGDRVAAALAANQAARITYVSCDPATLARDLGPLQAAGYRVEHIHLVDLFPQTYHLESVTQLVR
jgi:23S rRNA (uracil1939-C5)-methyltransferase